MTLLGLLIFIRTCQVGSWSEVRRATHERKTMEFSINGNGRISDASVPMVRATRSFASKESAAALGIHAPPLFYYVAMEEQAASNFAKASIASLRKKGEFRGPVVIVTDRPECLVATLGKELLGDSNSTKPSPGGATVFEGVDGQIYVMPVTPRRKYVKGYVHKQFFEQHKALARRHVARANLPFEAGLIVVIDTDVLVALPVKPFLDHLEMSTSTGLAVFADSGGTRQRFHCGVIAVYPGSDECMDQWLEEDIRRVHGATVPEASHHVGHLGAIDRSSSLIELEAHVERSNSGGVGQEAFASTKCANFGKVAILPEGFINITLTEPDLHRNPAAIFLHFTRWRRLKVFTHDSIQAFLTNFMELDVDIFSPVSDVACKTSTPKKYGFR
jgi:hypothetical protein